MALRIKALVALLLATGSLTALPLYTAREGRQCDSCHAYPFATDKQQAWKDPALADRKCNLSCQTCHLDPGGGGLRTVSGRYLSRAALPVMNSEMRPWHDQDRNIMNLVYYLMTSSKKEEAKPAAPPKEPEPKAEAPQKVEIAAATELPRRFKTHELPPFHTWDDPLASGHSFDTGKNPHTHGPEFGVYGKQNADPLFQFGADLRFAYVGTNTTSTFFPMQADFSGKFHPVKHFTAAATLGLVGQARRPAQARERGLDEMYTIRNAYLMYHELPYQGFVRAGMFQPTFGMRQEDHTALVRRNFEMDLSQKYSSVMGIEAGVAPNYPYLTVSAFTNNAGKQQSDAIQNYVINPQGFGTAVSAGWRDLAFGGGLSFMHKRRPAEWNGNLTAVSLDGYFNPGRFWIKVPLTFTGEIAFGEYSNTAAARRLFYANYLGVDYLLFNGVNLKVNHHFYDPDVTLKGNESGRIGFGVELIPFTWFKLLTEYRLVWAVDPKLANAAGAGIVNPFDWMSDKQWVIISHIYF